MEALGGGAVSYERGNPVGVQPSRGGGVRCRANMAHVRQSRPETLAANRNTPGQGNLNIKGPPLGP